MVHFPAKEHLLAKLIDMLCDFQWKQMEATADEDRSSIMAICLELTSMASACEDNEVIKDFFISAYTSPMCLAIIRKNDAARAKKVFGSHNTDWTEEQFAAAEILCSGIEYATLMTADTEVPLERRISGALNNILGIYGISEEVRQSKITKVLTMDYRSLCKRVIREFRESIEHANEQALLDILNS